MRIALLYSGHLRSFAETLPATIEYFSKFATRIDIFYCFIDLVEYKDELKNDNYIMGKRTHDHVKKVVPDTISKILEPHLNDKVHFIRGSIKTVAFEMPITDNVKSYFNFHHIRQFYLMRESFEIIGSLGWNNYDLFVRMRTDVVLKNEIPKALIADALRNDQLIASPLLTESEHSTATFIQPGYAIFMGNQFVMKKAMLLFDHLDHIKYVMQNEQLEATSFNAIFNIYLKICDLKNAVQLFNFNYKVIR